MTRRIDAPPLTRCGALPCPWMAHIQSCPHRIQSEDRRERFQHALCSFYSMPGPHAPSKIAKTLGISVDTVAARIETASMKIRQAIREDPALARSLPFDVDVLVADEVDESADHLENVA